TEGLLSAAEEPEHFAGMTDQPEPGSTPVSMDQLVAMQGDGINVPRAVREAHDKAANDARHEVLDYKGENVVAFRGRDVPKPQGPQPPAFDPEEYHVA
ncbi:MAG: hypothetical protein KDI46_10080, partial [Alphaproteobacteria bacterium]|nr:hypothetical protein [Alphaproteobacteria bacterium]